MRLQLSLWLYDQIFRNVWKNYVRIQAFQKCLQALFLKMSDGVVVLLGNNVMLLQPKTGSISINYFKAHCIQFVNWYEVKL